MQQFCSHHGPEHEECRRWHGLKVDVTCCSDHVQYLEKLSVTLEGLSVYIVLTCLEYTTHKCLDLNRSRE